MAEFDTVRTEDDLLTRIGVGSKLVRAQKVRDAVVTMFSMGTGTGGDVKRAGTITEARNLSRATLSDGDEVSVYGYAVPGGHPGVVYFWDADQAQADNAGTILQLSDGGAGRLVMAIAEKYDVRWWGVVGDNTTDDTAAFKLCLSQMGRLQTVIIPSSTGGNTFRMRLTSQIIMDMWGSTLECAGGGADNVGAGVTTGNGQIRCDYDDDANPLFLITAAMTFRNCNIDMDGNKTTAIRTFENAGGAGMGIVWDHGSIMDCGKHGIICERGVNHLKGLAIEGPAGSGATMQALDDGSVGILLRSDSTIDRCEITGGFNYGIVVSGSNWTISDTYCDQCRIGAQIIGIQGRINGGRFAFNWTAGVIVGVGRKDGTYAGVDYSTKLPRKLSFVGVQFPFNGDDRAGSNNNKNGCDIIFDGVSDEEDVRFIGCQGGQEIDDDQHDITTFGIFMAGTAIPNITFSDCQFIGYTSGEFVLQARTSTVWSASLSVTVDDLVYVTIDGVDQVYRAQSTGTTGSTAPSHVNYLIVTDGTISWGHIGRRNQSTTAEMQIYTSRIEIGDTNQEILHQTTYGGIVTKQVLTDPANPLVNLQTGTSYTAVLLDAWRTVSMNNASASTFIIPPSSSVLWCIGDEIEVWQNGAGLVTITQGSGVTLNADGASGSQAMAGRYFRVRLRYRGSNVWDGWGDFV